LADAYQEKPIQAFFIIPDQNQVFVDLSAKNVPSFGRPIHVFEMYAIPSENYYHLIDHEWISNYHVLGQSALAEHQSTEAQRDVGTLIVKAMSCALLSANSWVNTSPFSSIYKGCFYVTIIVGFDT
jgi:hypothetical protein